jgi:dipeptidyl-peptidase-4
MVRHFFCAASIVAALAGEAMAASDKLTPEIIHGAASLSGASVRGAGVSPDGSLVTFLKGRPDASATLDLWAIELATGAERLLVSSTTLVGEEGELSEEEKNRRERQRIYDGGIIDYKWDKQGKQILFPLGGDVFLYDLDAKSARRLTETKAFETDVKFSPEGNYVSFIRDDEVVVVDIASGKERQATKGANGVVRNGVAEFVAQEELDRDTGYWWAPGDARIAFAQIDESPVPIAERIDINADNVVTIRQRYPFAGAANVKVRLGVTTPMGGKPVWVDLGANPDIYLARVYWSKDGEKLYVMRLSRDQRMLDFLEADPRTGKTRTLFTETAPTFVNLPEAKGLDGFFALKDGGFLRISEQSGFARLYRHGADGAVIGEIGAGPGVVATLDCVDEDGGLVYFGGWRASPLDRHLFVAPLAGGAARPLTKAPGQTRAAYSNTCRTAIREHASDAQPLQVSAHDADGSFKFWLNENRIEGAHPYARFAKSHLPWTYGQVLAADGKTRLDYKYLKPAGLKRGERAPAIIHVYGGPHVQYVKNDWSDRWDPLAQMLADEGYVVFRLDNRGASNRGAAFENPIYKNMGVVEVADQAEGAKFLKSLPFVDPARIGVYGWSYGGYMTLRMLTATPDLYAAGVSGAPVTDWALYDTAYTERYLGLPEGEGDAYQTGSVFSDLGYLKGKLLVIHGMADDNVIFQNSVKLMGALQKQGAQFEIMTYPGEKHGFRATENKIHRDRLILDFFNRSLKGE